MNPPIQPLVWQHAAPQPSRSTIQQLACFIGLALVVMILGRFTEFLPTWLHPAILLLAIGGAAAITTGGVVRITSSPITLLMGAFTVWSMVGLPFSVWPGGAVRAWVTYWVSSLLACYIVVALIVTLEDCRKAMQAIALTMAAMIALSFRHGADQSGRLSFDRGSLGNANTLAMVYLLGFPFCVLAARSRKGIPRLVAIAASVIIAASVVRTGSRSGLLAMLVLIVMMFWRISLPGKVGMVLAGVAMYTFTMATISQNARERLAMLFEEDVATDYQASAMLSSKGRKVLLRRSISTTLANPLFGVGTGMFAVAHNKEAASDEDRTRWGVTHNAYTQVSSETGIPGLILYAAMMISCIWRTRAAEKDARKIRELQWVADMGFHLRVSLIGYAIMSTFASIAYECYLPILAGVTASFTMAAAAEIAKRRPARAA